MVNCKWCGTPTSAEFTQECDRCWELHWRIEDNPQVALQMLAQLTPLAPDVCHSTADGRHLWQNDVNGRYCFACGTRK